MRKDTKTRKNTETKHGLNLDKQSAKVPKGYDGGLEGVTMTTHDIDRGMGGASIQTDRMSGGGLRFGPAGNFKEGIYKTSRLGFTHEAEVLHDVPDDHIAYLGHFADDNVLKAGHNLLPYEDGPEGPFLERPEEASGDGRPGETGGHPKGWDVGQVRGTEGMRFDKTLKGIVT